MRGKNNPQRFYLNILATDEAFHEILATITLKTDTLKDNLKVLKSCQIFGGEGLKIRVNWTN